MKKLLFFTALLITFSSCNSDKATTPSLSVEESNELSLNEHFVEYGNLRIYAIEATDVFLEQNAIASDIEVLKTALKHPKFRISEHKPFGRMEDNEAVNMLTVENKLPNDVYLMSGDVVQGGKQDRTIADDRIIASNSIKNSICKKLN